MAASFLSRPAVLFSQAVLFFCALPAGAETRLLTATSPTATPLANQTIYDVSADGNAVLFKNAPITSNVAELLLKKISPASTTTIASPLISTLGCVDGSVSSDGRYVTWETTAGKIYWLDTSNNQTRLITGTSNGQSHHPVISDDGRYVAFSSSSTNLISNTALLPQPFMLAVYLYDSTTQQISIVSLTSKGTALDTGIGTNQDSVAEFDLSGDGRYVVFSSNATNGHPSRPSGHQSSFSWIYRREISTGTTVVVNSSDSGASSGGRYVAPKISTNGNRVIFAGTFVGEDNNIPMHFAAPLKSSAGCVFVKDLTNNLIWWVNQTLDSSPPDGSLRSYGHSLSGDGTVATFVSNGSNFVSEPTDTGAPFPFPTDDLFRVGIQTGGFISTSLITKSPTSNWNVEQYTGALLPADGRYIAFNTNFANQMLNLSNQITDYVLGVGVGTFAVTPPVLTFTSWAQSLPSGQRGQNDNPAKDGVANLVKYFMGMNGSAPDVSQLPAQSVQTGQQLGMSGDLNRYLTLQLRIRRTVPTGYTWKVCSGADLVALAADNGSAIRVSGPIADGDFDRYVYRFPTAINGNKGFMRVKLEAPATD